MNPSFATALVTGGTGFVGRRLVARLKALGVKVSLLQRSQEAIEGTELLHAPDFSDATLTAALEGRRFEAVFHLAAYGVTPTDRDPALLEAINVDGPPRLVRHAAGLGARAFVLLGSGSEYDFAEVSAPLDESGPLERSAPYGETKARGGVAALDAAEAVDLAFALVRMFNVYGPGENPHRLLPSLTRDLMRDQPVKLSPATQLRDFLFIDDAVEAIVAVAQALAQAGGRHVFNLASGEPVRVRAFCEIVARQLDKPLLLLEFGALAMRPGETPFFGGDPARLQGFTGWRPRHGLENGIALSLRQLQAEHS
jgi:nucleoside-diphosphate-sugar epimerase